MARLRERPSFLPKKPPTKHPAVYKYFSDIPGDNNTYFANILHPFYVDKKGWQWWDTYSIRRFLYAEYDRDLVSPLYEHFADKSYETLYVYYINDIQKERVAARKKAEEVARNRAERETLIPGEGS